MAAGEQYRDDVEAYEKLKSDIAFESGPGFYIKNLTEKAQVRELADASKVSVFFIDDFQVVRPKEVGSAELIRETAKTINADLLEYELEVQFRCGGSKGYVNWIDNTLGIRETPNVMWKHSDPYEFRIVDSVTSLEKLVRERNANGDTARLVAGYCWNWSNPDANGQLVNDVVLDHWSMPWNARPNATRLARGIPKSLYWASDPNGINQVGCIYTAQGFEFDYAGVIFGPDLVYNPDTAEWMGNRTASRDRTVRMERTPEDFTKLVQNTYRVLLTRGMKGCFVYFMDANTRNFFKSRVQ